MSMGTESLVAGVRVRDIEARHDVPTLGLEMHRLVAELLPIPRSLTGDGVRETLARLGRDVELHLTEIPSGTKILDWIVPSEWNVRAAWIDGPNGERVADLAWSPLHIVGYSRPIRAQLSLSELRPHLHSIPEHPAAIPYRTSYYEETWGFCLPHERLEKLREGEYEVCIESSLAPGSMTLGEITLAGQTSGEVVFSAHVCHPGMANDNLSGIAVAWSLARLLGETHRRLTYRFVFAPGTIGAIAWLHENRATVDRIRAGVVLAGIGDRGKLTYKGSRRGDSLIDRAATVALRDLGVSHTIRPFTPTGYDERQYGSPGFDLPVGCLMRTPPLEYPEYHSSADDLDFVAPGSLAGSLIALLRIVVILEANETLLTTVSHGEPQLGRRGVVAAAAERLSPDARDAVAWVLNLSDGSSDLLGIAERSGLPFLAVRDAADLLSEMGLLEPVPS